MSSAATKSSSLADKSRYSFPINTALLAYFFRKQQILLLVIALCVAAYSVMIIALWPLFIDDGMQEMMDQLSAMMPGLDAQSLVMSLGQYLETQWLSVYWLPLAGAAMIVVAAKAIGGSVGDGSMEIISSAPLRRATYFTTIVAALFLVACLLGLATIVPLALCGPAFEAELELSTVVLLLVASILILFVLGLFVLAVSSFMRSVAPTAGVAVAFILIMLVLYMATPSVEALQVLEPINLLHWWGAGGLIDGGKLEPGLWIWLTVVGIVSLAVGAFRFPHRDLT